MSTRVDKAKHARMVFCAHVEQRHVRTAQGAVVRGLFVNHLLEFYYLLFVILFSFLSVSTLMVLAAGSRR
jgi:hypothetical protein